MDREDIDVLHGPEDLNRLDPSGAKHGFLAQFQRTLIRLAGPAEESTYLQHHVEDVRAGRFVIMVLAKDEDRRELVANILNAHGAEFISFYGRWAWQLMSGVKRPEVSERVFEPGHVYETDLDGVAMRLRFDLQNQIVDATITRPDGTEHHTQGSLRRRA